MDFVNDTKTIETFAEAEVRLAEALPGYESRPAQQTLAREIEQAIATEQHLIAQAGCGTGKSLGYLIPSVLSGKRVIVSTGTKALQDQIAEKDLPFLHEHLGVNFRYAVLKGKSNYACLELLNDPANDDEDIAVARKFVAEARENGEALSGERSSLPELSDESWAKITLGADDESDCTFGDECFYAVARAKAAAAHIVVVNHALLCIDAAIGGHVLGSADLTVVDEVHELTSYAANVFGARITLNAVRSLVNKAVGVGLSPATGGEVLAAAEALFAAVEEGEITPDSLTAQGDEWVELVNVLGELVTEVAEAAERTDSKAAGRVVVRARKFAAKFADFVVADFANLVRWVEVGRNAKGREFKILRSSPVDVGPFLAESIWDVRPAILTSATVGEFSFACSELGLARSTKAIDVGSPFDFASQARLYVPKHLPDINDSHRDDEVLDEIEVLIDARGGRTLVLFTSVARLRRAARELRRRLPYTVLAQGEAPNAELAQRFAAEESSVLCGTKSFFTGVDFQGSTCTQVILEKIPFGVPTEPVTKAKVAHIEAQGRSGFFNYSVPTASVVLQQAVGRLIRTKTDVGVVAILDDRLVTKSYGKRLINDLPPIPLVHYPAEVEDFLASC